MQEDNFIEFFAVQHEALTNEDLDGTGGPEKGQRETRGRRSNWRTEEIHNAGNGKEIFFEEALLVFEAQDLNVEQYTKVAAVVQNAIQCYLVIYEEKKRSTT